MPLSNPYLVALYVALVFVLVPTFRLVWNMAVFFVTAISSVKKIDAISADVTQMKEEKAKESNSTQWSLSIIESDINALQDKMGLEQRRYPDRRIGPPDRRSA